MNNLCVLAEFQPGEESSDDDEETIAQAEQEGVDDNTEEDEIAALKRESEKPLEDLFDELPPGYLESLGLPLTPDTDQDSCIQPVCFPRSRLLIVLYPISILHSVYGWLTCRLQMRHT